MAEIELKPCPFCGGAAYINEYPTKDNYPGFTKGYWCGCQKCNIFFVDALHFKVENGQPIIDRDGYTKVIERWNRRIWTPRT